MIYLTELQRRFPHQKIKSQPAEGCGCGGTGVRHIKSLNMDRPCLCVCMSAPEPGEKEYRAELAKAVGQAARMALEEMKGGSDTPQHSPPKPKVGRRPNAPAIPIGRGKS